MLARVVGLNPDVPPVASCPPDLPQHLAWPYVPPPINDLGLGPDTRLITPPFDDDDLRPPAPSLRTLQFDAAPDDASIERLSSWVAAHPHVEIRAYGFYSSSRISPRFLDALGAAQHVALDLDSRKIDLGQHLDRLPTSLTSLRLSAPPGTLNLAALPRFTGLEKLSIEGPIKNASALGELATVTDLTLRSVKLDDLRLLESMTALRSLDIKLGGTTDLKPIADIGAIEYLELWQIRGFTDLSPAAGMPHLKHLFLQSLRNVAALPDLAASPIERIHIQNLKALSDLKPLLNARKLRKVRITEMPHLRAADVSELVEHDSLEVISVALSSRTEADLEASAAAAFTADARPRIVTSNTTHMRRYAGSRKRPQTGDVFEFEMPDGLHSFGRVIDDEAEWGAGSRDTCLLVYLFRGRFEHADPDRAAMKVSELAMPPLLTDSRAWAAGCFRTVTNLQVTPDERLSQHAFLHRNGTVFDERGRQLAADTPPNADLMFSPFRSIDAKIALRFGFLSPHDL